MPKLPASTRTTLPCPRTSATVLQPSPPWHTVLPGKPCTRMSMENAPMRKLASAATHGFFSVRVSIVARSWPARTAHSRVGGGRNAATRMPSRAPVQRGKDRKRRKRDKARQDAPSHDHAPTSDQRQLSRRHPVPSVERARQRRRERNPAQPTERQAYHG